MTIYLVLENRYDDHLEWTEKSKVFLQFNDALRYRYELITSDEEKGKFIPIQPSDTTKSPNEIGPYIIKEVWLES